MSDHEKKSGKAKFCAVRSERKRDCACGNNHIKCCEPKSPPWLYISYTEQHNKETGIEWNPRGHEAHHILCVSSVGGEIEEFPKSSQLSMRPNGALTPSGI